MFLNPFINLYSRDAEASLRFYRNLPGFKETFRTPKVGTPVSVEVTVGGFGIGLGAVEAAKRVHGVDAAPGSPSRAVTVRTYDVDQAFQMLTPAGVRVVSNAPQLQ